MTTPQVVAVCISEKKGGPKHMVDALSLRRGWGAEGDAHAGNWHRQVSLLRSEDVDFMRAKGLKLDWGAFGENIVTAGFDLAELALGRRVRIGPDAVLQVTQHGKQCHTRCAIFDVVGTCVMPTEGVFCRVLAGGPIRPGDPVRVEE